MAKQINLNPVILMKENEADYDRIFRDRPFRSQFYPRTPE